jgi:bifunctional non-homologous end joining protein LigD
MIIQDEQGRSDFHGFNQAMTRTPERLVFMALDLMNSNCEDLRKAPLLTRRERLRDLLGCHNPGCRIQYSEHVIGGGAAMFEAADQMALEGVVSKGGTQHLSQRAQQELTEGEMLG